MFLVETDAVEVAEVEDEAVTGEGLSAHAVLLSGTSNLQFVIARELQGVADIVFAGDAHHALNRCPVQVSGIVDEASAMLEVEWRCLRLRGAHGMCFPGSYLVKEEGAH